MPSYHTGETMTHSSAFPTQQQRQRAPCWLTSAFYFWVSVWVSVNISSYSTPRELREQGQEGLAEKPTSMCTCLSLCLFSTCRLPAMPFLLVLCTFLKLWRALVMPFSLQQVQAKDRQPNSWRARSSSGRSRSAQGNKLTQWFRAGTGGRT